MARINKDEVVRLLAARMDADEETAAAWLDAVTDTLYAAFRDGESVTLPGLGGLYV